MSDRIPDDACPYARPFPEGFDACPGFQPVPYVGLDMSYRPMPAEWTCAHLEAAAVHPETRFYARCRLGDAQARLGRAERDRAERIGQAGELSTRPDAA